LRLTSEVELKKKRTSLNPKNLRANQRKAPVDSLNVHFQWMHPQQKDMPGSTSIWKATASMAALTTNRTSCGDKHPKCLERCMFIIECS